MTLALAATLLTSSPAAAERCDLREQMLEHIKAVYGASVIWAGFDGASQRVELFRAADGKWVILLTRHSGIACVAGAGADSSDLMESPRPKAGKES